MKRTLILTGEVARKAACRYVLTEPEGSAVTFGPRDKKREQEEKYHAMIGQISSQAEHFGQKRDLETWKRLLIAAFVIVLRENAKAEGKDDPFPEVGALIPALNGKDFVQVGVPSSGFTIKQASQFIEYLYAFGEESGVRFVERRAA